LVYHRLRATVTTVRYTTRYSTGLRLPAHTTTPDCLPFTHILEEVPYLLPVIPDLPPITLLPHHTAATCRTTTTPHHRHSDGRLLRRCTPPRCRRLRWVPTPAACVLLLQDLYLPTVGGNSGGARPPTFHHYHLRATTVGRDSHRTVIDYTTTLGAPLDGSPLPPARWVQAIPRPLNHGDSPPTVYTRSHLPTDAAVVSD